MPAPSFVMISISAARHAIPRINQSADIHESQPHPIGNPGVTSFVGRCDTLDDRVRSGHFEVTQQILRRSGAGTASNVGAISVLSAIRSGERRRVPGVHKQGARMQCCCILIQAFFLPSVISQRQPPPGALDARL
jgi:hypothetical protein